MQKTKINRRTNSLVKKNQNQGFTLTEILVALAIVAIVVTLGRLAFRDDTLDKLNNQSKKLYYLLQLAQEESIIRGIELGLRVERESYYFMVYSGEKWSPLIDHKVLKLQEFQEPYQLYAHIEGQEQLLKNVEPDENDDSGRKDSDSENSRDEDSNETLNSRSKKNKTPQVYILSSGEMNEFTLTFGVDRDEPFFYRITGSYIGELKRSKQAIEGHHKQDWDKNLERL